jgi:SNF2 family DNA or RNA helicase
MLTVALTPDGTSLVLARSDGGSDVREVLGTLGIPATVRRFAGRTVADLAEGAKLLRADAVDWTEEARRCVEARHRIREAAPDVLNGMRQFRDGPIDVARSAIGDSAMASILDDHQVRNVAAMTTPGGWGTCVFDEQGTGKTVTLITAFDLLIERNQADILLVVSPKSMIAEWAAEFGRFTDGMYRVAVADGSRRDKVEAIRSGADVVVMSYDTVSSLTDEVMRLSRRCRLVLAVDESFNAKNPDAVRTAALMRVRENCVRAFALCGTPAPNRASDLISQFDLVDMGLTFDGLQLPKDRADADQAVRSRLGERGFYLRSMKHDVLPHLPVKNFMQITVELEGDQRRAYEAARADLILDLRDTTDQEFAANIGNYLARRSMLLRICSDPTPVIPGYSGVPAKVAVLDQLLDRLVTEDREKVVLWSFYRATLDLLSVRFAHLGVVRVDGSVASPDRRDAVSRFQSDDDVRVFIGNPAAAGAGLTLTAARIAVYESMSNQAAHYMQSLDRIHRRGQVRDVDYYYLLCEDTIEGAEHDRILEKTAAQGDLLGDEPPPSFTRVALLDELLATHT